MKPLLCADTQCGTCHCKTGIENHKKTNTTLTRVKNSSNYSIRRSSRTETQISLNPDPKQSKHSSCSPGTQNTCRTLSDGRGEYQSCQYARPAPLNRFDELQRTHILHPAQIPSRSNSVHHHWQAVPFPNNFTGCRTCQRRKTQLGSCNP